MTARKLQQKTTTNVNGAKPVIPVRTMDDLFTKDRLEDKELKKLTAAVAAVFSNQDLNLKAVLRPHQIAPLIKAILYAEKYNSDMMRLVIRACLEFSVSEKGTGRKNLETVLKTMLAPREVSDETNSRIRRLIG